MNARHDSHDFFQRFVPQGECVSVLFLQFRRQIYLHIIPFGQKRANLIQRPVFKYNLIACPRDRQKARMRSCAWKKNMLILKDKAINQIGKDIHK